VEAATSTNWWQLAFAEGFDRAWIERLAELATPVRWGAGETVYRAGDVGSPLYLVEEGRVALEMLLPGRNTVTIQTMGPGEIFGWSSLFSSRPKTSSARATIPTRALAFDSARLRAECDADPALGYALTRRILQVVTERLKATRIQLLDVFRA
jgi:CRP-like cAMP-binding protein